MFYTVKQGDSLIKIAREVLGEEILWRQIATLNGLFSPYKIFVGQHLNLPANTGSQGKSNQKSAAVAVPSHGGRVDASLLGADGQSSLMYARAFFFVLADEILPSGEGRT